MLDIQPFDPSLRPLAWTLTLAAFGLLYLPLPQLSVLELAQLGVTVVLPTAVFFIRAHFYVTPERACALELFSPPAERHKVRTREIASVQQLYLHLGSHAILAYAFNIVLVRTDAHAVPWLQSAIEWIKVLTMTAMVVLSAIWCVRLLTGRSSRVHVDRTALERACKDWIQAGEAKGHTVWVRKIGGQGMGDGKEVWELKLAAPPSSSGKECGEVEGSQARVLRITW